MTGLIESPISARAAAIVLDRARQWYEGNTFAGWEVKDLELVMGGLRERGVIFEDDDLGADEMIDGLADFMEAKAASFKVSEGNSHELSEVM